MTSTKNRTKYYIVVRKILFKIKATLNYEKNKTLTVVGIMSVSYVNIWIIRYLCAVRLDY